MCHESLNRRARARWVSSKVTSSAECLLHSTTRSLSPQVTIEELSDKVLLKIFSYFLDASPRHWIGLVHICHKWRRIVFEARQPLSLRLFCTHSTLVLKTLDCWPALPIIVEYGGSLARRPPDPKDEDNIIAALKRSKRVHSITLTITDSLLKKLSTLEEPFSELEELVLLSGYSWQLILPNTFRWGPRLRRLHSTSIAYPAFLQLLSSSNNLVDLRLHDLRNISHFSPEELTKTLSRMAQLRSFSLHLSASPIYCVPLPPSEELFVLPALTRLDFRGVTWYLEGLVTIIDAPQLEDIEITLFDNSISCHSRLCEFIDRMEMHKSHSRAHVSFSKGTISVSLMQPGRAWLRLEIYCKSSSAQLYFMAQICVGFSPFLLKVRDLRINTTRQEWSGWAYLERWLEILNSFPGVMWLHLNVKHLTNVVHALLLLEPWPKHVLPAP